GRQLARCSPRRPARITFQFVSMWKRMFIWVGATVLAAQAFAADALTTIERRWIDAGRAAVSYARRQNLPLDVIVQPDVKLGDAPLAMAYIDGRCKLVLTLRGRSP